jgi:hypothetical protein
MSRLALACLLWALLLAPVAAAQTGDPLQPIAPAPATPTPAPTQDTSSGAVEDDVGRGTLYLIGGALVVIFAATAIWITRDARRSLPEGDRPDSMLREEGPHKLPRQAKAKRRAKGRAAKAARRRNR